jgi:hypothetical protein
MAAFAILAPPTNHMLAGIIANKFPKHYKLDQGQWIVAEVGATAQQVAEKIGLGGTAGTFAVFSIAGFFGYHDKALWEWLQINSG